MKNIILALVFTILFLNGSCYFNSCFAQATILWEKTYGSSGTEFGQDIQPTSDGGFIVSGDTGKFVNHNRKYGIVGLDGSGAMIWNKSLGTSSDDFHCHTAKQTTDGGYIVIGNTNSSIGELGVFKLDPSRNITWNHNFGDATMDYGSNDISQTMDGGYIMCGNVRSNSSQVHGHHGDEDAWVVKLNANGDTVWTKTLGGTGYDIPGSIIQNTNGEYFMVGSTGSIDGDINDKQNMDFDYWVVKLNANGTILWSKTFGGTGYEFGNSIKQTSNPQNYIVFGTTYSDNFFTPGDADLTGDYGLLKIDDAGIIIWAKNYNGLNEELGSKVIESCGGYLMMGTKDVDYSSSHSTGDFWLVKTDDNGNKLWDQSFGGSQSDYGNSICQAADGSIVIAGSTYSSDGDVSMNHGDIDYWVVKLTEASAKIKHPYLCPNIFLKGNSYDLTVDISNNTCNATPQFKWTVSNGATIVSGAQSNKVTIKTDGQAIGSPKSTFAGTLHPQICVEVKLGSVVLKTCEMIDVRNKAGISPLEWYIARLNCINGISLIPPTRKWPVDIWGPRPFEMYTATTYTEAELREIETISTEMLKEVKIARQANGKDKAKASKK